MIDGNIPSNERGPSLYGPARQVFADPFLIIVGTAGESQLNMRLAVYIANSHYTSSETRVEIVLDSELTAEKAESYNLVLVGGIERPWLWKLRNSILVLVKNFAIIREKEGIP